MKLTDFRLLAHAVTTAEVRRQHGPIALAGAFVPLRPAEGEALYRYTIDG